MSIINNIKSRLNFEIGKINIKFSQKFENPYKKIWLVGYGRSGTTWLSNIINFSDKYLYMFEPFHRIVLKEKDKGIIGSYVRPNENNKELYRIINSIFSHNLYNKRVYLNKIRIKYDGMLVKDINANLILKWVKNNFPDIKIVFLMRHPFAVSLSIQKLQDWTWLSDPGLLYNQNKLYDDYLKFFSTLLEYAKNDFEKRVLIWCINHYVPLLELDEKDYLIVFYEDVCVDPIGEINRIYNFLNIDFQNVNQEELNNKINLPSKVSREDSAVVTGKSLIDTWKNELTSVQIKNGLEILNKFSLDKIYCDDLMPNRNGLKEFLSNNAKTM